MPKKNSKALLLRPYLYLNDFNTINQKALSGLLQALIQPVFEIKDDVSFVYSIEDISLIENSLKRLKFNNAFIYDCKDLNCGETQFVIISTKQYSACVIFDFSLAENENEAIFSSFVNSKQINEILKIILPDKNFQPERRENVALNKAFLNLIKYNVTSEQELKINEIEKKHLENLTTTLSRDEFLVKKSRYISHEIKNYLSIIDIYTKIIEKKSEDKKYTNSIFNSIQNITKLLSELKNFAEAQIDVCELKTVIEEILNDTKVLAIENEIELTSNIDENIYVMLDKNKFKDVLVNLIKNAVEALKDIERENKYIKISSNVENEKISILVENNGDKISTQDQKTIFDEGFTTKSYGSGLGLFICKQNLKEQFCDLTLKKSDKNSTIFEITANKI